MRTARRCRHLQVLLAPTSVSSNLRVRAAPLPFAHLLELQWDAVPSSEGHLVEVAAAPSTISIGALMPYSWQHVGVDGTLGPVPSKPAQTHLIRGLSVVPRGLLPNTNYVFRVQVRLLF
jgi:hypothetical protein